jgi:receptor expression-enhancing protein 5/6
MESIVGPLLQFIPFYFFLKVVFLLILFLPQYNGAAWIYDAVLKRIFNKYEDHICKISSEVVRKISNTPVDVAQPAEETKHKKRL